MASSTLFLLALIGVLGLVSSQIDRDDINRENRERESTRPADGCMGKVMDIFFLMDSSSSIYINDYMSQHRFVRDVISRFDVSPDNTRVGMLTFSDDLERPVMSLNRYTRKGDLLASISIQNLPYRTGVTNTDIAIRYVRQLGEFRQDITKVMVVLTDGGSRSPGMTAREAELARNAGFYIFVVGIGQYLEEREWRSMASDPDDSFIFNITNPRLFQDVKYSLPPRACALPPIILGGSCNIGQMSEVYFVASRSASNKAIDVIENFKRRSRDQRDLLRLNFLIEACGSITNSPLDDRNVNCDRFGPSTGDTAESVNALFNTARAIARASRSEGGSSDSNQVIVLFADDETMALSRFEWSNNARTTSSFEGVKVIVVDLGLRTYQNFAQRMVTSRNDIVRFLGGSVNGQTGGQRSFIDATCRAINERLGTTDLSGGVN